MPLPRSAASSAPTGANDIYSVVKYMANLLLDREAAQTGSQVTGRNDFLSARHEMTIPLTLPCGFPDPDPYSLFGAPAMLVKRAW